MDTFSDEPDLSLQIRPPNCKPISQYTIKYVKTPDLGPHRNVLSSKNVICAASNPVHCSNSNKLHLPLQIINGNILSTHEQKHHEDQNPVFSLIQKPSDFEPFGLARGQFQSSFPLKKRMRAPKMRWTSTLHAHFLHVIKLLGGHKRATPKSVFELMDIKDLTLAHVKSHLQTYRAVKTTGRAPNSSGQRSSQVTDFVGHIIKDKMI